MSSAVLKFHSKTYILKQNSAFNNALFFCLQYPSHKKYRKALRFPAMSSFLLLKRKLIKE